MATRYIDLNCSLAQRRNETNNRWTYPLPDGLELPTGTQVSVQNSLVNLQGITGQSIEIEEDVNETICFNYYMCDSTYNVPVTDIGDPEKITDYKIFANIDQRVNLDLQSITAPSDGIEVETWERINRFYGYSENIMPLCGFSDIRNDQGAGIGNPADSDVYLVPLCGQATIFIPKGIYSVASLGELISDQINKVKNPNINQEETYYEQSRENGAFRGLVVNNTTNRFVKTEEKDWWQRYKTSVAGATLPPATLDNLGKILNNERGALRSDEYDIKSAIAIKPAHMGDIFFQAKNNVYNSATQNDTAKITYVTAPTIEGLPGPYAGDGTARRYFMGFMRNNGQKLQDNQLNLLPYNVFTKGMGVGTTGFTLKYDGTESAFSFQHLHEPRRIPTHDNRGNTMSNPSQEAVYIKRVPQYQEPSYIGDKSAPMIFWEDLNEPQHNQLVNSLNAYVMRYSGVLVYNWAFQTASNKGNVSLLNVGNANQTNPRYREFWNFDDFFTTEKEAKKAWKETIWSRIGFSYDKLVNSSNYEKQFFYGESQQVNGTTTMGEVDSSLAPYISTLFNNYGKKAESDTHGEQFFTLPAVGDVQMFNLLDSNVPQQPYNNNKNADGTAPEFEPDKKKQIGITAPYQGSFYDWASMIPVQTSGKELKADSLPILSQSGYMLVLTDLVNQDDFAGKQSELGIIDMIPKSSLSNQDFIADRNFITHTLSNPKSINSVSIAIVNPDLTDLALEPNSTILLKLVSPVQKPTILLAETDINIAQQQIEAEEEQNIKQAQEAQAKQVQQAQQKQKK
jgi:hypothetical protein